nr:hypothetical protein [uncultured Treponema sp.]
MSPEKSIDIKENDLLKIDRSLLEILLKDKTTGKNIIWATDNYSKYGELYTSEKEIKIELITSRHGGVIKPRVEKSKEERLQRVRQKAEVFTPSWICNMQNNKVDEEWFGRRIIAKPCVGCTKGDNRKHNGIYCIIKDWETHRNIRFVDMIMGDEK